MVHGVALIILVKQSVLINAAGRACLSDVGFTSKNLEAGSIDGPACGSRWAAPEVFINGEFSEQSDMFSFGFVAAEVCFQSPTSYIRD